MSAARPAPAGPELAAIAAAAALSVARLQGARRPVLRSLVEAPRPPAGPGPWVLAGRIAQHAARPAPPRRPRGSR